MFEIIAFVRYSNASLIIDWHLLTGAVIFLILCGLLIIQNKIWEDEYYLKNKKWLDWKAIAIKSNRGDLSKIYPTEKQ